MGEGTIGEGRRERADGGVGDGCHVRRVTVLYEMNRVLGWIVSRSINQVKSVKQLVECAWGIENEGRFRVFLQVYALCRPKTNQTQYHTHTLVTQTTASE